MQDNTEEDSIYRGGRGIEASQENVEAEQENIEAEQENIEASQENVEAEQENIEAAECIGNERKYGDRRM